MNAFTVRDLKPSSAGSTIYNNTCPDVNISQSINGDQPLNGEQMSKETFEAMSCMLANPAGANEDLWQKVYRRGGICMGLSVNDYFSLIAQRFQESDPNKAFLDLGATNRTSLVKTNVNSNELKETLNEQVGRNTLVVCNNKEELSGVEVCLEKEPPYQIIDCQEEGKSSCLDDLNLRRSPGSGQISDYCKRFIPNGIIQEDSVGDIAPNTADVSSSSNLGIILGATIGGVAALLAAILLVIILRRQKRHSSDTRNTEKNLKYASDSSNLGSISAAAPSIEFDPFVTWLRSVDQHVGSVKLTHPKEFSFSNVTIKKPIGEGSFGKVCLSMNI